jgi:hypothetical protein
VGSFRTRYSGGIPVGEELAKILLLACCYQEGPRDRNSIRGRQGILYAGGVVNPVSVLHYSGLPGLHEECKRLVLAGSFHEIYQSRRRAEVSLGDRASGAQQPRRRRAP